jgi:tRNA G10  N-methylase Trm11
MNFDDPIIINGNKLNRNYIESLNKEQREALIEPIFHYFRNQGFIYPDNVKKLDKEYKRLIEWEIDINNKELYNNSSVGTYICKYFCKSFYKATERGQKNMIEIFNDDEKLKKIIENRLGLNWYKDDDREAFTISFRQIIQGMRSTRSISMITMFKPEIAKYMYLKYSNPGDFVYDFSAGFGGRMLGAAACDRNYIGVDPLTIPELIEMRDYFNIHCSLIDGVSEEFCLEKNSIDFAFSSPPYNDQEYYDDGERQAYNKGDDYFYNTYWRKTLDNIKFMLKPGKIFALNVKNYPKMVDMTKEKFELVDEIYLRTIRSHLNKTAGTEKMESIYIFRND